MHRYQIIIAHSLIELEKFVNTEMNHLWSPTGGLISFVSPPTEMLHKPQLLFAQAMIKHLPPPPTSPP